MTLLANDPKFREHVGWIQGKNPTDPFQAKKELDSLTPAQIERIKRKARIADHQYRDGSLFQIFEGSLARIDAESGGMTKKLNPEFLFERIGKPFEKFCEATGLDRYLGIKLNPGEFLRLPFIRNYREDIAKKNWLIRANSVKILKKTEDMLQEQQERMIRMQKEEVYKQKEKMKKAA